VAALAWITVSNDEAGVAVVSYNGMNGIYAASAPVTLDRPVTGQVDITFPAVWVDEYDVASPVAIRGARAWPHQDSAQVAQAEVTSPNTVTVRTWELPSSLADSKFTLKVW